MHDHTHEHTEIWWCCLPLDYTWRTTNFVYARTHGIHRSRSCFYRLYRLQISTLLHMSAVLANTLKIDETLLHVKGTFYAIANSQQISCHYFDKSNKLSFQAVPSGLQGDEWTCTVIYERTMYASHNRRYARRTLLCSPWWPPRATYQAPTLQPGILRRCVEQFASGHPNCTDNIYIQESA